MHSIVIDTNIFISALIKEGLTRKLIINSQFKLFFPEYEFIEIKNNKEEIIKKSGLSETELINLIRQLLKYVKIVRDSRIVKFCEQVNLRTNHKNYRTSLIIKKKDYLLEAVVLQYPVQYKPCCLRYNLLRD